MNRILVTTTNKEEAYRVARQAEKQYGMFNVYSPQWEGADGLFHYEVFVALDDENDEDDDRFEFGYCM